MRLCTSADDATSFLLKNCTSESSTEACYHQSIFSDDLLVELV